MSFDFQLAHACPHLTIEEEVLLGSDRRELRTRQPVASANHIRITANDQVSIPRQGLLSNASLSGASSGPFKIVKNENRLTVVNRTESVSDVVLPIGTRVPTDRIVETLSSAVRNAGVRVRVDKRNGSVVFTDLSDQGTASHVRVEGSAAASLGFAGQVRARGRKVYPAWDFAEREVVETTKRLNVRKVATRFPRFREPVRGNPVFKVSYTTYQQHCRRCLGYGIENDYRIAADGEPRTVENEDLLNQDGLKILSTVKNSNPFHPEYGTRLLSRIGAKALGEGMTTINEDVTTALTVLQRLQDFAGRWQEITARQRLASIVSIDTTPSPYDPTVFEVVIVAANAANVPVVISTVFAAPGTAALAGTSGLSLGLEGFGLDPQTRALPGTAPG
jgi:hypothetical protein